MSLSTPSGSDPRGAPPVASGDSGDIISVAISERIVDLYLEAFGRGPTRVRTYVQPQFAVCILRDTLTTSERSSLAGGDGAEVESARARVNQGPGRRRGALRPLRRRCAAA
jgi:uncharacterized protein YbcI